MKDHNVLEKIWTYQYIQLSSTFNKLSTKFYNTFRIRKIQWMNMDILKKKKKKNIIKED